MRTIIAELNSSLLIELDMSPTMSPSCRMKQIGPTILVIGASNAGRMADALEKAVERVSRAVIPGWRCIKPKIPAMVDLVRSKLDELRGTPLSFCNFSTTASSWRRLKMEG